MAVTVFADYARELHYSLQHYCFTTVNCEIIVVVCVCVCY